jgi:hypothetical protein
MMAKRKAKAAVPAVEPASDKAGKLSEAQIQMWDAINHCRLIYLAADKAIDDKDNAEDYAHAVCTAAQCATEAIKDALDLIGGIKCYFCRAALADER